MASIRSLWLFMVCSLVALGAASCDDSTETRKTTEGATAERVLTFDRTPIEVHGDIDLIEELRKHCDRTEIEFHAPELTGFTTTSVPLQISALQVVGSIGDVLDVSISLTHGSLRLSEISWDWMRHRVHQNILIGWDAPIELVDENDVDYPGLGIEFRSDSREASVRYISELALNLKNGERRVVINRESYGSFWYLKNTVTIPVEVDTADIESIDLRVAGVEQIGYARYRLPCRKGAFIKAFGRSIEIESVEPGRLTGVIHGDHGMTNEWMEEFLDLMERGKREEEFDREMVETGTLLSRYVRQWNVVDVDFEDSDGKTPDSPGGRGRGSEDLYPLGHSFSVSDSCIGSTAAWVILGVAEVRDFEWMITLDDWRTRDQEWQDGAWVVEEDAEEAEVEAAESVEGS